MIRLFTAISMPQDIKPVLYRMGCSLPYAKPIPEDEIHLTLRFIGEVEGNTYLDIKERLSTITSSSFALALQGVGHFPPRGKPRIIWAGVEPTDQVKLLKRKIDTSLLRCQIAPDKRKFSPHVTFARVNSTGLTRVIEFLTDNAFFHCHEFDIKSFHLYSSRLSQKGATHFLEASYPLFSG